MFTLQPHPILIDYICVWWGFDLDKEPAVAVLIWHFGWLIGRRKRIWGVIAKESKVPTLGIQGSNVPRLDTPVFSSIAIWTRRVWNISLKQHFNLHLERSRSGMNAWSGSYLFFRVEGRKTCISIERTAQWLCSVHMTLTKNITHLWTVFTKHFRLFVKN